MFSGGGKQKIYDKLTNFIENLNKNRRIYRRIPLNGVFLIIDSDNAGIKQITNKIMTRLQSNRYTQNLLQKDTPSIHNNHYATVTLPVVKIHIITISSSLNHILSNSNINQRQLDKQLISSNNQFIATLLNNSCINNLLQLI